MWKQEKVLRLPREGYDVVCYHKVVWDAPTSVVQVRCRILLHPLSVLEKLGWVVVAESSVVS